LQNQIDRVQYKDRDTEPEGEVSIFKKWKEEHPDNRREEE